MATHILKSWTFLFDAMWNGKKTHDIRSKADRDFKVGDTLRLREYRPECGLYTGRELEGTVSYITSNATPCALSSAVLHDDFAVLSVEVTDRFNLKREAGE